jgi:hypothetical protein
MIVLKISKWSLDWINSFLQAIHPQSLGFNYLKLYAELFYIEEDLDCDFLLSVPISNYSYLGFR